MNSLKRIKGKNAEVKPNNVTGYSFLIINRKYSQKSIYHLHPVYCLMMSLCKNRFSRLIVIFFYATVTMIYSQLYDKLPLLINVYFMNYLLGLLSPLRHRYNTFLYLTLHCISLLLSSQVTRIFSSTDHFRLITTVTRSYNPKKRRKSFNLSILIGLVTLIRMLSPFQYYVSRMSDVQIMRSLNKPPFFTCCMFIRRRIYYASYNTSLWCGVGFLCVATSYTVCSVAIFLKRVKCLLNELPC